MNIPQANISSARLRALANSIIEDQRRLVGILKETLLNEIDIQEADHVYERLRANAATGIALGEVLALLEAPEEPVFLVSSEVLYKSFERLSSIATESIDYVFGMELGNIRIAERLVPIELEESEFGYAAGDLAFTIRLLARHESFGSKLIMYTHMHPGRGPESNLPSSIDLTNQKRLEEGKYITIGASFSRDGFVRFFSNKLTFMVIIIGKGITNVSDKQFKLSATNETSVPVAKNVDRRQ